MSLSLELSDCFLFNSGMHFDKNTIKVPFSVYHISRQVMSVSLMIGDNFYHLVKVVSANPHCKVTIFSSVLFNIFGRDILTLCRYPVSCYTFVP